MKYKVGDILRSKKDHTIITKVDRIENESYYLSYWSGGSYSEITFDWSITSLDTVEGYSIWELEPACAFDRFIGGDK